MTAHTPGPWRAKPPRVNERDPVFHHCDVIAGGIRVAVVAGVGVEQAHANAALIAAAPATAAMLERALDALAGLLGGADVRGHDCRGCGRHYDDEPDGINCLSDDCARHTARALLKEAGRV